MAGGAKQRADLIVGTLSNAFDALMKADPDAFRSKFRKMAADPFAFYRGSACVFYADVTSREEPFSDDASNRVWIHGDLHVENFGSYLNSEGVLVFDVNDFDEAYLGSFMWDLRRFVASLALLAWQKALPEDDIRRLVALYVRAYVDQVHHYVETPDDHDFALRLDNTDGAILAVLERARLSTRVSLLESTTQVADADRHFVRDPTARELDDGERSKVEEAFAAYLETIPQRKREHREVFYDVKDIVGRAGFGIGSAGLPAYNILIEGFNQALENDVVLSMKQANVPAISRYVDLPAMRDHFQHEAARTVASQRALQAHSDPFLGFATIDGEGYVVSELSPYEVDLDWSELTEPDEMAPVVQALGCATAKIHCVSDEDSDEDLVDVQTEDVIAGVVEGRVDELVDDLQDFAVDYAERVRGDHALFVDAFRGGGFDAVSAS